MKEIVVFLILGFLIINCTRIEAKTKRQINVSSKQHVVKRQKTFPVESSDSVNNELNDSLNLKKHIGNASWYSYRGGLFAASTRFKKGSILRVINPANNKYVDVVVNDYGPNKRKHPNRIIDLDKIAFKQIAQLRSGVINIIVCPIKVF